MLDGQRHEEVVAHLVQAPVETDGRRGHGAAGEHGRRHGQQARRQTPPATAVEPSRHGRRAPDDGRDIVSERRPVSLHETRTDNALAHRRLRPATHCKKGSRHSITERRVPALIPVLGSQPAGDVNHKPDGKLSLLSAKHAVTPVTLKRAATNFAAW